VCVPTYEYECQSCHQRVEAVQGFADPALTTCELCGGDLRKVFSAVGIAFKGSGFYKNDSRKSKEPSATPSTPKVKPATSESSSSSTPGAPAAPAAASTPTSTD
jgi:putative FmdB family regulatory protein